MKIGIIILNYLNYWDTIECIESLEKDTYLEKRIIVVDNGSLNESWNMLSERYDNQNHIYLLKTEKNEGFARGNNKGIEYARNELDCEFVLLVNNDTIFTECDMIYKILCAYDTNIGVIGARIISANGLEQNPMLTSCDKNYVKTTVDRNQRFVYSICKKIWHKRFENVKGLIFFKRMILRQKVENRKIVEENQESLDLMLHGACILLTKDYFEFYPYLYPETFLYYEEHILTELTRKVGLKKKFINTTSIYHKEDQSSEAAFQNQYEIIHKYAQDSAQKCLELFDMDYHEVVEKFFEQ